MTLNQSKSRRTDVQTPAQKAATARNFQIFNLRSLYKQARLIRNTKRRAIVQALIDDELSDIGAETEADRSARRDDPTQFAKVGEELPF